MDAISLLMDEHQAILRALDALDAFVAGAARSGDERAELGRFVRFIREFADARHHAKEEDILFRAMEGAGFSREMGPVAVMLMDHDAGRAHTSAMAALASQATPWTPDDRARVAAAAGGYTDLLRGHIMKEDQILYPMAQHRLHDEAMAGVDRECAAFEARNAAQGETLRALGRDLVERHLAGARAAR